MRVAVAEDDPFVLEGIVSLLRKQGFDVVASATNGSELLTNLEHAAADVLITDLKMPPTGMGEGVRVARQARERHPDIGVVVLTAHAIEVVRAHIVELFDRLPDHVGFLLKESASDIKKLHEVLEKVSAGGCVVDERLWLKALSNRRPVSQLNGRLQQTLSLMSRGYSNRHIASELGVRVRTVEDYASQIYMQLGVGGEDGIAENIWNPRVFAVLVWLKENGQLRSDWD